MGYTLCLAIMHWSTLSINLAASLSYSLAREKGLEAKLSSNTKALKYAETRLAATEAWAAKSEKALAKAKQGQTKHEQAVVERIDALLTSFGNDYFLVFQLFFFCSDVTCVDYDVFAIQQNKFERSTSFTMTKVKTLYLMLLAC
jgi:hypothetical protein